MVRALLFAAAMLSLVAGENAFAADRYALIVGVKQYKKTELTDLKFSEADATELAAVLKVSGYEAQNVVLMTQARGVEDVRFLPTAENIRAELELILKRAEAGDSVLIAFAGHGVQFKGEKGAFFCPMDAQLAKRETLLPLADIYAQLEKCPASAKFLLVDACRNEAATELRRAAGGVELEAVGRPQSVPLPKGLAAFFSCDEGQFAYEHSTLKHGVFFHFVLEGLRGPADLDGDRGVDIDEINTYVRKRVKDYVAGELGQFQSPRMLKNVDGTPVLVRLERPAGPPPSLAIAPFDAATAKKHQQDWATYLKVQPVVTSSSTNMKLALIPPGEFLMGSPEGEKDRGSDETQHRVRITKPFYLGVYEVTQAEYQEIAGENPSGFASSGEDEIRVKRLDTTRFPVERVAWVDAGKFCQRLSAKDGSAYRLPTEAEWEYACRAGTITSFHFGGVLNGDKANVNGNYPYGTTTKGTNLQRTATVGTYAPNAFGLYDMHGNVWEWCSDWYGEKYYETLLGRLTEDPSGESPGTARIYRGGSWVNLAGNTRSSARSSRPQDIRVTNMGFRVVLSVRTP